MAGLVRPSTDFFLSKAAGYLVQPKLTIIFRTISAFRLVSLSG
jgi:hypothetical protein